MIRPSKLISKIRLVCIDLTQNMTQDRIDPFILPIFSQQDINNMKKILLVAHGSRLKASNHEVVNIAASLTKALPTNHGKVRVAFLELAEPSIPDALQQYIDEGVTHITVLPYFLAAGSHVNNDIPKIIRAIKQENGNIQIDLHPHTGAIKNMTQLLIEQFLSQKTIILDGEDKP